jgi:hypothetical protein
MKYNLKDVTFLIPLRIDSADRLRNVQLVVGYLMQHFDTNVYVLESSAKQEFFPHLFPGIKYVYKLDNNPVFHRTKLINDMIVDSNTKKVSCYDADVLLPISSYIQSSNLLDNDYDVVYPYPITDISNGAQKSITLNDLIISNFKNSQYDIKKLEENNNFKLHPTAFGHCFFINRLAYIKSGMENENFISWGPEDYERHHRFKILGNRIGRLQGYVYHLEHSRGINSGGKNPYFESNTKLFNFIKNINNEDEMFYYINSLEYYNNRLDELKLYL